MADLTFEEARAAFIRTFKDTARHEHRYEVWRDFVTMSACALHNGLRKEETREAEYLSIIEGYCADDQARFPQLLANLITMLEPEPSDVLGPLYMELEIASKDRGQFFTPSAVSDVMAQMTFGDELSKLDDLPFITVQEPACGAGGMVLALVKVLTTAGHDPLQRLWVECIDVDRVAALMCYVQLTLWNVPARVIVGNTLTRETREVWYTPAHYLGFWDARLAKRGDEEAIVSPVAETEPEAVEQPSAEPTKAAYQEYPLIWRGQSLTIRYAPDWLGDTSGHLEIVSDDKQAHPISETGYRSHFVQPGIIEEAGGPVAYVEAWLRSIDDGAPKQLSLF